MSVAIRHDDHSSVYTKDPAVICLAAFCVVVALSCYNSIPDHSHGSTKYDCHRRAHVEPHPANITCRGHHNPPRLCREACSLLVANVDVADLPQPVHGSVDQTHSSGIHTPDHRFDEPPIPDGRPDPHRAVYKHNARPKYADVPHERSKRRIVSSAQRSQSAKIHGKVEVRAGESLDDCEADEEVARTDPTLRYNVVTEQWDHDWTATKDDGTGKEHVGEEDRKS